MSIHESTNEVMVFVGIAIVLVAMFIQTEMVLNAVAELPK